MSRQGFRRADLRKHCQGHPGSYQIAHSCLLRRPGLSGQVDRFYVVYLEKLSWVPNIYLHLSFPYVSVIQLQAKCWLAVILPGKGKQQEGQSEKEAGATCLVAQWLRIRLPMQGTRVQALVREDPTSRRATKPVRHNY